MLPLLSTTQTAAVFVLAAFLIFLFTVALGRWMKRRLGIRLGALYRMLCAALAIYVPLVVLRIPVYREKFNADHKSIGRWFDLERELLAAMIVLGAFFLIAVLRRYLWEIHFEKRRGTEVPQFLRELVALVVMAIALIIVLSGIYGYTVPGLLAGSGILAIILGLAMQDLLGNVISGIALEIGKPFRPGDWLQIDTQFGRVVELNWRSVRLCTNDLVYLDIPNNQIVRGTIQNLTYPERQHAIRIRLGIDYHIPPNDVRDVLVHAAGNAAYVMNSPAPKAFLRDFGDSAIIYEVKFFIEDHARLNDVIDAVNTNIWYELKRRGMSIPFPIRTVQLQRAEKRTDDSAALPNLLRQLEIFRDLEEAQLTTLLGSAQPLRFGRGERIIEQGREGESMFVLVKGTADVYVDRAGIPARVATLPEGSCFGEMSLLTGEERSATVTARTDCEVLEIGKAVFKHLLDQHPPLVQRFSELLAQRRMENEGILASAASETNRAETKRAYTATFFAKLSKFFEI